ncbi:MAG: B12-binding domain-containing radical SAM protein [Candidatus Kuenenia sp.]|nr:B12-binding domain-containing radical SAM protein [Candidatus Kuenenia hertensis]
MNKKVTFIAPYDDLMAYGIRILSSSLRKEGFSTEIIFTPYILKQMDAHSITSLADAIKEMTYDSYFVGISFFSCHFNAVKALTEALRSRIKVPIMWGGKHISARPDDAAGYADIVSIGEAEIAIKNLLSAMKKNEDYSGLNGFWFLKNGNYKKNQLAPIIEDLDLLPYPDYSLEGHYLWDGTTMHKMTQELLSEHLKIEGTVVYQTLSSRGCPYSCTYCSTFKALYSDSGYLRFRTAENVVDELKEMKSRFPGMQAITFCDDNFFALKEDQLEKYAALYKKEIGLPLRCLAHAHDINKRKLEILVDAGMNEVQIGIQTGSERTRKLYKRGPSTDKVLNSVRLIHQFKGKLMPFYDFIIDNPFEEEEDLIETLHMIQKFPRPYRLNVFSLIFLPGTELQKKAQEKGLIFDMTRQFESRKKTYINFLFYLYCRPIPRWIMGILISKPMLKIMKHKVIVNFLYFMRDSIKRLLKGKDDAWAPE